MNDNRINTLNTAYQIRDIAIRGNESVYEGDLIYIYWQTAGRFLLVYLESIRNDWYGYRIYQCGGKAEFDTERVVDASLEAEDFKCVFQYKEIIDQENYQQISNVELWYEEYKEAIAECSNS